MKKRDCELIESNNTTMSRLAVREIIAELRGNRTQVIKLDEEHRRLGQENVAVMKK